jgi:bifunctional DNA-binding transcriptional regulator/antitoxin component of YhaV-PrlF toxin-antitoxin module
MEMRVCSTRGRVTVPVELRRKPRLRPGTVMEIRERDGALVVRRLRGAEAQRVRAERRRRWGRGGLQARII